MCSPHSHTRWQLDSTGCGLQWTLRLGGCQRYECQLPECVETWPSISNTDSGGIFQSGPRGFLLGWSISCGRLLCQHNAVGIVGLMAAHESAAYRCATLWCLHEGADGRTAHWHQYWLLLHAAKASVDHIFGRWSLGVQARLVLLAFAGCR